MTLAWGVVPRRPKNSFETKVREDAEELREEAREEALDGAGRGTFVETYFRHPDPTGPPQPLNAPPAECWVYGLDGEVPPVDAGGGPG